MAFKDKETPVQSLTDAIIHNEKELDKEVPGASFALVSLTYPLLLAIFLFGTALFYWLG